MKKYIAIAPGSLMLFGEHAVLHGSLAIVAAMDKYIHAELTPRTDNKIVITTAEFGQYETSLDAFTVKPPLLFVLMAIKKQLQHLPVGFELKIDSDFSAELGFGSSAAVTVATVSVLMQWLNDCEVDFEQLFLVSRDVVREVQGIGSGADVAASVFRGVLAYKTEPLLCDKLDFSPPLVVAYSGAKKPTREVIALVEASRRKNPELFAQIFAAINLCSEQARVAINQRDWLRLGELMNIHQGLHDALGVNSHALADLVFNLRSYFTIFGAKISGSGLGDCVVAVGSAPAAVNSIVWRSPESILS